MKFLYISIIILFSICSYAENTYRVIADRDNVHDGDTLTDTLVVLPFGLIKRTTLRLYGIDAPELKEPTMDEAIRARNWLWKRVSSCDSLRVAIQGTGSFGRTLATVYCNKTNINEQMLRLGLAVPYKK